MNGLHGIIFSYEKRNDLRELTEIRSAASIPFGGRYRAVDFALSNLVNAGVTDVGVVLHGRYQSMVDHLGTGKVWDLSRKRGVCAFCLRSTISATGAFCPSGAKWRLWPACAATWTPSGRTMWPSWTATWW